MGYAKCSISGLVRRVLGCSQGEQRLLVSQSVTAWASSPLPWKGAPGMALAMGAVEEPRER